MAYKPDTSLDSNSKGEILANSITHGIGVGLSLAGIVFLVLRALTRGTSWHVVSFSIFGFSLLILYLASTIYHSSSSKPWRAILQRVDHAAIYFLIAGTYTPFLLTTFRTGLGWTILVLIWGMSLIGLILKLGFSDRFEKPTVFLYILMGWAGAVVFIQAGSSLGPLSFWLLLGGGIFYTAGVIFYRWEKLPYSHAIWHLFVLGGSILHYFSVLDLA